MILALALSAHTQRNKRLPHMVLIRTSQGVPQNRHLRWSLDWATSEIERLRGGLNAGRSRLVARLSYLRN